MLRLSPGLGLLFIGIASLQADLAADYAALTAGITSLAGSGGTPGTVVVHGRHSFPLISENTDGTRPVAAAGYFADNPNGARCVAYAHTGWTSTTGDMGTALVNAIRWAGRKTTPVIGRGPGTASKSYLQGLGFAVQDVSTSMASASSDLTGVDVFLMNLHSGYSASALSQTTNFNAHGGGLLLFATPWALNAGARAAANDLLLPFGLTYSGSYNSGGPFPVPAQPFSPLTSALNAADALLDDFNGRITLSLADKRFSADAIDATLAVRPNLTELTNQVQTLSDAYGWINVISSFDTANRPVEAMLVRYQSSQLDVMPPAQLPVDLLPTAAAWPGLPATNGPVVSQTIFVNGDSPPPDPALINWGGVGSRLPLGLYAPPGAVIRVTIPADKINEGLRTQIGVHVDVNFHHETWRRYPKVVRYDDLNQATTEVGCAFGGLIFLRIPPGKSLGTFPITVSGAIETPHFVDGTDSDADWNGRLKHLPGAWGYIQTSNMTVFASRRALQNGAGAQAVATFWARAISTADHYLGYLHRWREEAAITDRQISVGFGHAGYPVMMEYGDSEELVKGVLADGDWGFYHELGHTFQDDGYGWNGTAGGEVDVNFLPHLLMTLEHQRSIWDNDIHSTMNADSRFSARNRFFATPLAERNWSDIRGGDTAAYDFYFNLVESFGHDLWRRAFSRFYRWTTNNASEPSFAGLDKYNRWFVAMCEASGHNLGPYFDNYGWPLDATVKARFTGLPVWTENRPPTALTVPADLAVSEDTPAGTVVATLTVTDPDPGNLYNFAIVSGNADDAFAVDRWTGELRVVNLDYERQTNYTLTITVFDNALPRYFQTNTVAIRITNVAEPPQVYSRLLAASSAMPAGAFLGVISALPDTGRRIGSYALVGGDSVVSISPANGFVRLQQPELLPQSGVFTAFVEVTDDAGATARAPVQVLVNGDRGLRERRWNGLQAEGIPVDDRITTVWPTASIGDHYTRQLRAGLVPPRTGWYTFWISASDDATLFLGTNANVSGRMTLCTASHTDPNSFEEQASQRSAPVWLEAGLIYHLEARQTEASGSDHVEVAWVGPGLNRQLIPATQLIAESDAFLMPCLNCPTPPFAGVQGARLKLGNHPTNEPVQFQPGIGIPLQLEIAGDPYAVQSAMFWANGRLIGHDVVYPYSLIWTSAVTGTFVLQASAHENILGWTGNDGTIVTPPRTITVFSNFTHQTLIPERSAWRYHAQGLDLGTAWRAPEYDDRGWSNGLARLGFGGDGEVTTINGGPSTDRYPTVYFRRALMVNNLANHVAFTLGLQRDDGAVVYINGQEVWRSNMPDGAIGYTTRAAGSASDDGDTLLTTQVSPAAFVEGTNVIAVEVHQASAASSDLTFLLTLDTVVGTPGLHAVITSPVAHDVYTATQSLALPVTVLATTPIGQITNITVYADQTPIGQVPGPQGEVVFAQPPAGQHTLTAVAINSASQSVTSAPVTIDLRPNTPPNVSLLSPLNGARLEGPVGTLLVEAAAEDNDGGIAQVELFLDNRSVGLLTTTPFLFLLNHPDAGDHTLVATATDHFGLTTNSPPVAFHVTASPVFTNAQLISAGATWKYRDDGVNLGNFWVLPAYNDSSWSSGPAKLGFGNDSEVTTLSGQPVITYYFRRQFVTNPDLTATNVALRLIRDDGAVVYLNGQEVFRNNMPGGLIGYSTRPLNGISGSAENQWVTANISADFLQAGANVIAVEVHQINSGSSDIGFDLELAANGYLPPPATEPPSLNLERTDANAVRLWFSDVDGRTFVIERSADLSTWQPVETNVVTGGRFNYAEPWSPNTTRFYRARLRE